MARGGHGKFTTSGKTKPRSNPGKSKVRGAKGGKGGMMRAAGKGGLGQAHERMMKGNGGPTPGGGY